MRIHRNWFGRIVIKLTRNEKTLLRAYVKELGSPDVSNLPHLFGHFLHSQIDFVLHTLASLGILAELIPDEFVDAFKDD